ncbi:hypothetical protein [Patulibacter sp. SYSU D01012]|uniref:hypothetical protein n=1 Tax=Patulibacter sp. SYSU D01012 TaxID=2817381 RepID=UPI001B305C17|nr:hypothetical protein [Patulibacter sp. SYSU D01012]
MEVPLVEHGSLMLRAAQRSAVLPNMALVTRFDDPPSADELRGEAARLAASPFGLGRRLRAPRVPGARPRWQLATEAPPVALAPPADAADEVRRWLDDELSVAHDPQHGAGWRLAAVPGADGRTTVALGMSHLYGTGRDVATTLYGGLDPVDPATLPAGPPPLVAEALDAAGRVARGARGTAALAGEAALLPWRRRRDGALSTLGRALGAMRDRDPSRGRGSRRRVGAIATVDADAWDARARALGGTPTSLQVAAVANLVREARAARGGAVARTVRLIVPVDLADRDEVPDVTASVGPIRLTSATVLLPGGRAQHGALDDVRAETRRAFAAAADEVRRTGRVPVAPGAIDAMKLLPDDVTRRVVFGVHGHYDGAASNVGVLPPGIRRLGSRVATDAVLMAFPLGSDLSVALARHDDRIQLGVVADPSRLGAGPPLRERLVAELTAWDVPFEAW